MMRKSPFVLSFLPLCLMLISSCAIIVPPSGGKADKTPPFPRSYSPDSAAVNFKSKTVEIQFDEYIVLKDLNTQIVISPPMEKMPNVKVKNKTLFIEFREPLKDSTTYCINFGTAIQDLHENNPITNFRYVFSTGAYVDSLSLAGTVSNAFTLLREKGVLVMMYNKSDDSIPFQILPSYFGRTDANGSYRINNIKPGTYKVVALKDGNGNYKINEGEMVGFRNAPLVLTHNDTTNFLLFQEKPRKQYLKKAYQAGHGKIMLAFNTPATGLKIRPLNFKFEPTDKAFLERNAEGDSITWWFTPPKIDSVMLEVSDKDKVYDTLRYKLITYEKMLTQRKGKKSSLSLRTNAGQGLLDLNAPITFEFDNPVEDLTRVGEKIKLTEDSLKINLMNKGIFSYKLKERSLRYYGWKDSIHGLKENNKYRLLVLPHAFTDIFGFYNDTLLVNFHTQQLRYYGTLKLNLHASVGNYVLQLLNEQEIVVREVVLAGGKDIFFEYLPPAKYHMRMIFDTNKNGKWDPGYYMLHQQPEHVLYFSQPVVIRSNWDQEVDWFVK
jgi:uncharacterized protein (DUF2141 family)